MVQEPVGSEAPVKLWNRAEGILMVEIGIGRRMGKCINGNLHSEQQLKKFKEKLDALYE